MKIEIDGLVSGLKKRRDTPNYKYKYLPNIITISFTQFENTNKEKH